MANLQESPIFESGIFQLERSTPPLGGAPVLSGGVPSSGHANAQALQLANRTLWLKEKLDFLVSEGAPSVSSVDDLREYVGSSQWLIILEFGSSGLVVTDTTINGDDGVTKFIDGKGRQWKRVETSLTLEECGISESNTPERNADLLKAAIIANVNIIGSSSPFQFAFIDNSPINFTGTHLHIDLGQFLHKMRNWGGITSNTVNTLCYNGRIDAEGTYCKGLGRFRNLARAEIGTFEFQNVFCVNPTSELQFFGLEYSSNLYNDNALVIDIENIFIKNVITQTYTQSSGLAIPMTILGNFGSASNQSQQHQINIGNFHIEEFYSVSQDGITPIDGDSDVLRLFTNPTQVNISSIFAKNVAKRFVKTQETALLSCPNVVWSNDSRFPSSVFIGFFEGQVANSGVPSHFEIGVCQASYVSEDTTLPLLFNASGLAHTINIGTLKYRNIGFFSSDQDVGISIGSAVGSCLAINAPQSKKTSIRSLTDSGIRSVNVSRGIIENFNITFGSTITTQNFILAGVSLRRGSLNGWRTNTRVAQFYDMSDVTLSYSSGTSYVRAFVPITGGTRSSEKLSVTDPTGLVTQLFEAPSNGSGVFILRNFRATGGTNIAAGFFSSGSWEVRLDDCVPAIFTGVGAAVKTVTYT